MKKMITIKWQTASYLNTIGVKGDSDSGDEENKSNIIEIWLYKKIWKWSNLKKKKV